MSNFVYNNSSVCKKVFKFLLGGRILNENLNTKEWKELYKHQIQSCIYSETPFMMVITVLLNKIMPIALSQQ